MCPAQSAKLPRAPAPCAGERRIVVRAKDGGQRVDELLSAALGVGRRTSARLAALARRNGRPTTKGERVAPGDVLLVPENLLGEATVAPGACRVVRVIGDVAVIDKPAGLPSASVAGKRAATAAAWAAARFPECASVGRPGEHGLAHRLDTGTSGLLLVARDERAYRSLREQFRRRAVEKSYLAVVTGHLREALSIEAPIGRHPKSRRRVRALGPGADAARDRARPATTLVEPVRSLGPATVVRATTTSGVRHQVRVHLAHVGHPLLGDTLYGGPPSPNGTYSLHAERIAWLDPATGAAREVHLAPPPSWSEALDTLERSAPAVRGAPIGRTAGDASPAGCAAGNEAVRPPVPCVPSRCRPSSRRRRTYS